MVLDFEGEVGLVLQSLHFWVNLGQYIHNPSKQRWNINIGFFQKYKTPVPFKTGYLSDGFLQCRSSPTKSRIDHWLSNDHNKLHYHSCIQHCCLHHYKMDHLDKIQQNMVNLEYQISQSHLQKSAFLDQEGNNNILEKTICKNICKQPKSLALNSVINFSTMDLFVGHTTWL